MVVNSRAVATRGKLRGDQFRVLHSALIDTFPSRGHLARVARFELDEPLDAIAGSGSLSDTVFNLIEWAEDRGRLDELLRAVLQTNPSNQRLLNAVRSVEGLPFAGPLEVGAAIGQDGAIHITRAITVGPWGTIWEAWHERLQRKVVVKTLHQGFVGGNLEAAREFRASVGLMSRCAHPGVVEVLQDVQESGDTLYFVIPFLEGGSLRDAVLAARIPDARRYEVIHNIAETLACLHEREVLLRDLAPSNVVLTAEGAPVIVDFRRAISASAKGSPLQDLGTSQYIAPEALTGARPDARSDQYALGVLALFVLAGREVSLHERRVPPLGPREISCPEHVADALVRAMAPAPEERFATLRDFISALRGPQTPAGPSAGDGGELLGEAERFLTASGFSVTPEDDLTLRLHAAEALWAHVGLSAAHAYVHSGNRFNDRDVLSIRARFATEPRAFVVTGALIDDAAWLQIATLRATGFQLIPLPRSLLLGVRDRPDAARSDLRKHLDRFLGGGFNPFDARNPVADSISFFGRASLVEEMTSSLRAGDLVGLFGLRKMGKSSVLRVLAQRLPFPVAALDLEAGARPGDLLRRALRAWQIDARVRFHRDFDLAGFDPQRADDLAAFATAVPAMIAANHSWSGERRLGLLLDETELLLPRPGSPANEMTALLRCLRGLHQEEGVLALMLVGYLPTINRQNLLGASEEQNPLFKLVGETWLDVLAADDCRQMVSNLASQASVRFSVEAVDRVVAASGAHPFLARQLCSIVYKARRGRTDAVAPEEVEAAAARFVSNPSHNTYLSGLWDELGAANIWGAERATVTHTLLRDLAREDGPVPVATLLAKDGSLAREEAMEELLNRHVLREIPEGHERTVTLTFDLFRRWIRRSQRA